MRYWYPNKQVVLLSYEVLFRESESVYMGLVAVPLWKGPDSNLRNAYKKRLNLAQINFSRKICGV